LNWLCQALLLAWLPPPAIPSTASATTAAT